MLETARDDADRLLRILNDLLDLARLESGSATLHLRDDVPVAALLADMAREMKGIVDAAEQKIEIVIEGDLGTIKTDRDRVRHVFINLLANASKYSPVHSVITLYAKPASEGFVRFGVCDQGLTIAREIVVAHGGTIACASKPGEGSDFYFFIPAGHPGETA